MKTIVIDDYQVSLNDDGSFEVRIRRQFTLDVRVTYSPENKKEPWAVDCMTEVRAKSISSLGLSINDLKLLHEALEVIGKQDMMDNEIEFRLKPLEVDNSIKLAESEKGSKSEEGSKTDKYLWKAKSACVYKRLPIPCEERYTDVKELTVDKAVSWYKDWVRHLNDYGHDVFTVYAMGLFYKKDSEWVLYEENN